MIIRSFLKIPIPLLNFFKQPVRFCNTGKVINQNEERKNMTKTSSELKSIKPQPQDGYAYGHYFPKEWTE